MSGSTFGEKGWSGLVLRPPTQTRQYPPIPPSHGHSPALRSGAFLRSRTPSTTPPPPPRPECQAAIIVMTIPPSAQPFKRTQRRHAQPTVAWPRAQLQCSALTAPKPQAGSNSAKHRRVLRAPAEGDAWERLATSPPPRPLLPPPPPPQDRDPFIRCLVVPNPWPPTTPCPYAACRADGGGARSHVDNRPHPLHSPLARALLYSCTCTPGHQHPLPSSTAPARQLLVWASNSISKWWLSLNTRTGRSGMQKGGPGGTSDHTLSHMGRVTDGG